MRSRVLKSNELTLGEMHKPPQITVSLQNLITSSDQCLSSHKVTPKLKHNVIEIRCPQTQTLSQPTAKLVDAVYVFHMRILH